MTTSLSVGDVALSNRKDHPAEARRSARSRASASRPRRASHERVAPGAAGTLRIVVVGGSARAADDVAAAFARAGSAASCVRVATPRGLRGALRRGSCDVVVVDCALRRLDVLAAIAHVVEFGADLPVVAVSAVLDELALDILRAGAADYLLKADLDRLPAVVLQARRRADERRELHAVRERLSASEERFRTLAEATNQIVWTLGADGEADGPIDDWTAFTGQSPAEFAGRGWLDVVHTDDRERALRDWQTAVADGASYRSEYRLKMKGDGYRWMSSQAVPLRDAAGVVEQWIGADRDVTDHLKVVRDLAVAQDYNARVMAISPAFFCAVSADGRIVLMNQAMLDHLGYALDDVVGTEFAGLLIFDGDRAALEAEIWRALSDNASVTTELRMQAADGAEVLVEWRAAPVFAADGAFDHAVGVGVDVTERRCAVESLQRSDERYRTLSRTASSWVWTAALDGQPVEPFASFLEFTGMSAADLNGAGWLAAVHADDRQSTSAVWAASVASVAEVRLEYRLRRGDGEYEWFSVHGSPVLDNEGRLVEYVGTSINVHQRNLALEALRESEQRHRALFEQVPVGVFVYDRDLRVTECNLELARMMGVAPARLTGGDLRALAGGDVVVALEAAIAGEIGAFEGAFHVAGEGASPMVTMHTSPLRAADGAVSGGMAVVADVSERHRFFDRIDRLAFTDLVTGLPNRTAFDCRLQEAISLAALSRHKVALAVLNIDRFRRVHDTMGARAADRLLSAVGARLAGQVGRNDTVARASADEFLVLLPEVTGIDDIVAVSDRIAAGFRSAIQVDGEPIYVQFSIGVVGAERRPAAQRHHRHAAGQTRRRRRAAVLRCRYGQPARRTPRPRERAPPRSR